MRYTPVRKGFFQPANQLHLWLQANSEKSSVVWQVPPALDTGIIYILQTHRQWRTLIQHHHTHMPPFAQRERIK